MSNKDRVLEFVENWPDAHFYFSDVADELDMDLIEAVSICKELINDGKICVAKVTSTKNQDWREKKCPRK